MARKDPSSSFPTLGDFAYLPTARIHLIIATVVGASSLLAFYPTFPTTIGKSLAGWTWYACNSKNGFLHGRLVPLIVPWLMFVAFRRCKNFPLKPSYLGLIPLFLGLFLFWAGTRAIQPRISLLGAPFIILGVTYYFAGASIAKRALFPAFFLYFAIPIPGLEMLLNGWISLFILKATYHICLLLGMDLTLNGATISTSSGMSAEFGHGFFGIRLFLFTLMAGAILSYLLQKVIWKQWMLFLTTIPLLIFYTIVRCVLILGLAENNHEDLAKNLYHNWVSLFTFTFTIATLLFIGHFLKAPRDAPLET